ncbi:MAG: hypothetical protein M0P61_04820 [Ignavibacteriaceae bacterium]|jgi:hypothetical protein|nr:hypothetical protein [Ignavibacteriaceae bacterium]
MWSKFFRIPVLLLFLAITFYGCVEEPTIDPVKRPYTLLRVANFSYNVDTLIVSIDPGEVNAKVFTLYKNQLPTQYFEIESGKRNFLVKNPVGDTLYNEKISIGSYEELSLSFTGYSKPHDDLLNTFSYSQYTNGAVYLYEGMGKDTTLIQCANFAPDTPSDSSIKYRVLITDSISKKVVKEVTELAYNSFTGSALPGNKTYKISYAKLLNAVTGSYLIYGDTTYTFDTGFQYFVYGIGNPKKPSFVIEKITPLPIRSK